MTTRTTQAVVVIHGIGEQKPMGTVRRFVDAVLPVPKAGPKYFSKPDELSGSLELRKLQNREQPRTHFYEYYWASQVEGTAVAHVKGWAVGLLKRRPGRVPRHLLGLWIASWLLVVVGGLAWIGVIKDWIGDDAPAGPLKLAVVATALWGAVQGFLIRSLGDAARYLSPIPENIKLRRTIRDEGLTLLRGLHEEKQPDGRPTYSRIVVVGHSLGSVIAYDVIRQLWAEVSDTYATPERSEQPALAAYEAAVVAGTHGTALQTAQHDLFLELRELGLDWRITDLVTAGSPLAHAALLLADDADDLEEREVQRELPTCPPAFDEERDGKPGTACSYELWTRFEDGSGKYALRAVHHAGAFAPTRWTNLYVPTRAGLFGDPVGGPIVPWFGRGIHDRPVVGPTWRTTHTPKAHSAYWMPAKKAPRKGDLALDALNEALDLDG